MASVVVIVAFAKYMLAIASGDRANRAWQRAKYSENWFERFVGPMTGLYKSTVIKSRCEI